MFKRSRVKSSHKISTASVLPILLTTSISFADVFISEIHYDNASSDTGEAIEISGETSTDLSGWSIVLYNGSNGTVYNTINLTGTTSASVDCGANGGTQVINFPANGLQNGSPDGIALVNNNDQIVEFLSYEGVVTATNGIAAGLDSIDIGVSENSSTPIGHSLKLVNGVWSNPDANSFGECDTDVSAYSPTSPTSTPTPTPTPQPNENIFISEIHYDNASTDTGEAIEISGDVNIDLSGWSLALYNGSNGTVYNTINLSGFLSPSNNCGTDGGTFVANFPSNGLQNGSPDGIALIDALGNVVQFISYEGNLSATNGPASGQTSTDIGVSENSSTPIGHSLQLVNGSWASPSLSSFGECTTAVNSSSPTPTSTPTPTPTPTPAISAKIHEIQGTGDEVTSNSLFQVEAIVIGDYQASDELSGFFIQEEDSDIDSDATSSEGIFVYCDECPVDVAVGDLVQVTGLATEFFGMSQLRATFASDIQVLANHQSLPNPTVVSLPVQTSSLDLNDATDEINQFYETMEGMLISFEGDLSVAEYFQLARFGQLVLSANGRPRQFTDQESPSEAGYIAHQIQLAANKVILDDKNNIQNDALFNNKAIFHPQPGFSVNNFIRGGDTIKDLTGVLHWSWPGSGSNTWRIRPVTEAFEYTFEPTNLRTLEPKDVGGNLKVASFNVLNYFTTLDDGSNRCGGEGNLGCRGAHSSEELERQTQKIVTAICQMDADIIGLMELENLVNNSGTPAIASLTHAINSRCGVYEYVNTGTIGTDAITVGLIYKPESVKTVGEIAILSETSFIDPNNTGTPKNRPVLAVTFSDPQEKFTMTVAVNHLKSKGSACGAGDDDTVSGQGNCNLTRTLAAEAESTWLSTHPTGVETDNILILGDLNAYRKEDPITAFLKDGYYDLSDYILGADTYGFVFDGQLGYLDYALATWELKGRIIDVIHWHINADEVNVLDYNDTVRDPGEASFEPKPASLPLYEPTAYRSSDHDPVLIGIQMFKKPEPKVQAPTSSAKTPKHTLNLGTPYHFCQQASSMMLDASKSDIVDNGSMTFYWDINDDGDFSERSGDQVDIKSFVNQLIAGIYQRQVKVIITDKDTGKTFENIQSFDFTVLDKNDSSCQNVLGASGSAVSDKPNSESSSNMTSTSNSGGSMGWLSLILLSACFLFSNRRRT